MGAEHRYLAALLSEEHPELDLKDDGIHPTPTPQCGDHCASPPSSTTAGLPREHRAAARFGVTGSM